ncbi:hypothetical protein LPAF129_12430 [Ligilactobacillus pabuli]|uniref:Transposase n=1 Tax=Ligilactobacillus pabuli TaxID=2886039 RepID=A0ABQ5JJW3_9LACO|nr:hypothetical protein LPAF129_12430 [Ligilactobacillus pabuli]
MCTWHWLALFINGKVSLEKRSQELKAKFRNKVLKQQLKSIADSLNRFPFFHK